GAQYLAVEAEVLDETEDGIVLETTPIGSDPEQRPVAAGGLLHGQRRQGDQREREVDGKDRSGYPTDRARDVARRITCFLGEVGDGFDPRVGDHRDRDGEKELSPRGRHSPMEIRGEDEVRV